MRTVLRLALALALVGSACSDNSPSTTVAPTPTPTSPVVETFASAVAPSGTTSHSFTAAQAGSVAITLASSGPPTNVVLGVGVGIPTVSAAGLNGCSLTTALNTAPGSAAQLTVPVDAGAFCIKVFDPGGPPLGAEAFFSLTISRP